MGGASDPVKGTCALLLRPDLPPHIRAAVLAMIGTAPAAK
jgi:hypothetical protein